MSNAEFDFNLQNMETTKLGFKLLLQETQVRIVWLSPLGGVVW